MLYTISFLVIVLLGVYLSHFTRFGRTAYSISGNEKSAVLMGLPVGRTKVLIYTFNSLICAAGGLVNSLYTLSGYPRAGYMMKLDVIATVVIGGTLLSGGVGFVEGTLIEILISVFILFQRYMATRSRRLKMVKT